ncbi:hypothetical protein TNCV_4252931 [Trichonephila clavipes]|nr:hypothetical protein TNCV_4252931 [Trichonephila clavipes]
MLLFPLLSCKSQIRKSSYAGSTMNPSVILASDIPEKVLQRHDITEIEGWNFGITYYSVYCWDVRDHLCHICPPPQGVSFIFLSQASAAPFATTDSGPV